MSKKNKKEKQNEDQTAESAVQDQKGSENAPETEAAGEKTSPQEEIAALQQEIDELKDKYLRLFAEFDNYKRRTMKEKLDLMRTAAQDTMSALLPVLDDFDRAKRNAEAEGSQEPFSEGVNLVYKKLYAVLRNQGLEPMETNGEIFDPEFHEAFTEIPAPGADMKGRVVDTIERGYKLKDKIIRHAKVVVGK